jgi:putative membrane protein
MTAVAPTTPAAPEHREHRGWHIPHWAAITGGVLLLVVAGLGVLRAVRLHRGDRGGRFGDGMGRGFGEHAGNGHVHWVLWVIVILALVGGIALLVAASRSRRREAAIAATTAVSPAEQILAERFARGEIDEAEFLTRRDALRR